MRSNDPLAPPVIEHRLLGSDDDIEQIVDGTGIAREILGSTRDPWYVQGNVRRGAALTSREARRDYVSMAPITRYHPVGTAKIGRRDDPIAVFDPDLKMIGLKNRQASWQ